MIINFGTLGIRNKVKNHIQFAANYNQLVPLSQFVMVGIKKRVNETLSMTWIYCYGKTGFEMFNSHAEYVLAEGGDE